SACDIMIQPYPDGVSSRRTSFMAGLSHGQPMVTTAGVLTESLWSETGAIVLAPAGELGIFVEPTKALLNDEAKRRMLSQEAKALYKERFDLACTVNALRRQVAPVETTHQ